MTKAKMQKLKKECSKRIREFNKAARALCRFESKVEIVSQKLYTSRNYKEHCKRTNYKKEVQAIQKQIDSTDTLAGNIQEAFELCGQ